MHPTPGRSLALAMAVVTTLAWTAEARPARADGPGDREGVRLTVERYERLMAAARRSSGPEATWTRGELDIDLPAPDGHFVRAVLSARLSVVGDGLAAVALLPADVVLEAATIGGSTATLVQRSGAHVALLDHDVKDAAVELRFLVPVRPSEAGARLVVVPLPPLPGAAATVDAGDTESDTDRVDLWPGAAIDRSGDSLTASIPATQALALRWGAREDSHVVRRVDYTLRPDESGDGVDIRASFELRLDQRRAQVRLAHADAALTDLREGATPIAASVRGDWYEATVTGPGRHVLTATFRLAIDRSQGQPQVTLALTGVPITQVAVTVPGKRAVTFDPAVPVTTQVAGEGEGAETTARAFLPPSDEVGISWTESRAAPEELVRTNTETYQMLTLQEGVLRSHVVIRYQVIRGKVKELPVELPDGVVLYKVSGDGLEDWRTYPADGDAPRQVRVFLGRELEGAYTLELDLETIVPKEEGAELSLPLVRPLDAFREMGVVALFDGDKVGFGDAQQTQYTKAGEDALPVDIRQDLEDKVAQAFKHIGAPGPMSSRVASAKVREVRFAARIDTLYEVKESSLVGRASALVEVKSGRRDAFVISLPEEVAEPHVTAPSLNRVTRLEAFAGAGEGRKAYEISFTRALEGAIQIDVEFEALLPKDLGRVEVPALILHDAESQQGSLGLAAETGIEVLPEPSKDLRKVDVVELPKAVRFRSDREVQVGYHYAHVPWQLAIDVKRHKTVETRNAVVTQAWVETTILDSGHVETRALLAVANEDRQFLRLTLPASSEVLRVTAAGEGVKAVADEESGAIAIRLPTDRRLFVEVIYALPPSALGAVGSLDLMAPRADMRVSDLQWLLRAPEELVLYGIDTELKEIPAAQYRSPDQLDEGEGVPIRVPVTEAMQAHLFTYAVHDIAEPALGLSLSYVGTPGPGVAKVLFFLALVLLAQVVLRRASGSALGVPGLLALGVGLVAAALLAVGWGWGLPEMTVLLVTLVICAGVGIARRRRQGAR